MTTIAAIVDALLEQVGTIDNLNTGTVLAANMPTPVAIVSPPGQGTYRGTFGATGYLGGESWTVTVLVSASLVEDGMRVLHAAAAAAIAAWLARGALPIGELAGLAPAEQLRLAAALIERGVAWVEESAP